jgi:hypothetical protein
MLVSKGNASLWFRPDQHKDTGCLTFFPSTSLALLDDQTLQALSSVRVNHVRIGPNRDIWS